MASRNQLKQWFSTGKKPTQGQFYEVFDTFFHKSEDTITIAMVQNLSQILAEKVSAADLAVIRAAIGNLGNLQTSAKESLVAALNEVVAHDAELTVLLNDVLIRLDSISEDINGGRFIEAAEKGAAGGVASLDEEGLLLSEQLPGSIQQLPGTVTAILNELNNNVFVRTTDKGVSVATLDQTRRLPTEQLPAGYPSLPARITAIESDLNGNKYIPTLAKNAAYGVAGLDQNARINIGFLPAGYPELPGRVTAIENDLNGDKFIRATEKGAANGVASLNIYGKVPGTQLDFSGVPVTSVSGKTGNVTLTKSDVGLSFVDNTSDINKPISSSTQYALDLKASKLEAVLLNADQRIAGVKSFMNTLKGEQGFTFQTLGEQAQPTPTIYEFAICGAMATINTPAVAVRHGNEAYRLMLGYKGFTADRAFMFPNKGGTVALAEDAAPHERGTWIPTLHQYSSPDWVIKWPNDPASTKGTYVKVGKVVTLYLEMWVERVGLTNTNNSISIAGIPFYTEGNGSYFWSAGGDYQIRHVMTVGDHIRFHDRDFEGVTRPIGTVIYVRASITHSIF